MYTIGVDLGTTGCKAVIADEKGNIAGNMYIEYSLIIRSASIVEQNAGDWWSLSCRAVRSAMGAACLSPRDIAGISVTSQGISFILTDGQFTPLHNAISWLDNRALSFKEEIAEAYTPEEMFAITGLRLNEVYILPKLMWLKTHEPELFAKARHLLMPHDYLLAKMTGRTVTDHTMAGGTMLYDVSGRRWSEELLERFCISPSLLPELRFPGEACGSLTEAAAAELGLLAGTPVIVGGQDQKIAAYMANPGLETATLSLGTAGAMEFLVNRPVFDPEMRIPLFSFLSEEHWTLESVISTTGASLKWLRHTFFPHLSFAEMDLLAEESAPGSENMFFFPHFGGASSPYWQNGVKGGFYGLSLETGSSSIIRSVLEGIAYQVRTNLEICESLCGKKDTLIVFGSGSTSDIWCRIFAGITGKNITALSAADAAGLGAAKLAFRGAGLSVPEFGSALFRSERRFSPDPGEKDLYDRQYRRYCQTEKKILFS